MIRAAHVALAVLVMLAAAIGPAAAQAWERTFNYQGRLTENGLPYGSTTADLEFDLYAVESGGAALATVIVTGHPVAPDGNFSIDLDFGLDRFAGSQRWLQITVNGQLLLPRQAILPVPYTMYAMHGAWPWQGEPDISYMGGDVGIGVLNPTARLDVAGTVHATMFSGSGSQLTGVIAASAAFADDADRLDGMDSTAFAPSAHSHSPGAISPQGHGSGLNADLLDGIHGSTFALDSEVMSLILGDDGHGSTLDADTVDGMHGADLVSPWNTAGSSVYYTTGSVGIGTSSPQEALHVVVSGSNDEAIRAESGGIGGTAISATSPNINGRGVVGIAYGLDGRGVSGQAGEQGIAVHGFAAAESALAGGFYGDVYVVGNMGIGTPPPPQMPQYPLHVVASDDAIRVETSGVSSEALGVYATGNSSFAIIGSTTGISGRGVMGHASGPDGMAVFGLAHDPAKWAGFFLGSGHFSRTLSVGTELQSHALHVVSDMPGINAGYFEGEVYMSGKVGIGATEPTHELTVYSATDETVRLIGSQGAYDHGARLNFGDGNYAYIDESEDDFLSIYAAQSVRLGERVGIGTDYPAQPLHVMGNCAFGSSTAGNVAIGPSVPSAGAGARLHVMNGQDASLVSNGYVMIGFDGADNIVLDNNEIMARVAGSASALHLNTEGGSVVVSRDAGNNAKVGIGVVPGYPLELSGGAYCDGNNWYAASSVERKQEFETVDAHGVLESVAALPISTWTYKSDAEGKRHLGPMAEDFHAAFGLGGTDKAISALDAQGVALAAIQGLHEQAVEKDTRITELEAEVAELTALVRELLEREEGGR